MGCASSRWGRARTNGSAPRRARLMSGSAQSCGSANIGGAMGLSDVWARTLVYFGIAEEEGWDEDGYVTEDELADGYEQPNVRRLPARRSRHDYDDDWTDPEPDAQRTSILRPRAEPRRARNLQPVQGPGASRVHLILPRSFNDAQQVADRFKNGVPVILNLQSADSELSKRLIDFAAASPTRSTAACNASPTRSS